MPNSKWISKKDACEKIVGNEYNKFSCNGKCGIEVSARNIRIRSDCVIADIIVKDEAGFERWNGCEYSKHFFKKEKSIPFYQDSTGDGV